jgi:hypothetical protein
MWRWQGRVERSMKTGCEQGQARLHGRQRVKGSTHCGPALGARCKHAPKLQRSLHRECQIDLYHSLTYCDKNPTALHNLFTT